MPFSLVACVNMLVMRVRSPRKESATITLAPNYKNQEKLFLKLKSKGMHYDR
jgi:hypothetical protein